MWRPRRVCVLDGGRHICCEAPTTTRAEETPGNDELSTVDHCAVAVWCTRLRELGSRPVSNARKKSFCLSSNSSSKILSNLLQSGVMLHDLHLQRILLSAQGSTETARGRQSLGSCMVLWYMSKQALHEQRLLQAAAFPSTNRRQRLFSIRSLHVLQLQSGNRG